MTYRPLLISALLISFSVPAFSWGPGPGRGPDVNAIDIESIATQTLQLDANREEQLKTLFKEQAAERKALAEKFNALREERKATHEAFNAKMDNLLTEEERSLLRTAVKKEMRKARQEGEHPYKGKKGFLKGDCDGERNYRRQEDE